MTFVELCLTVLPLLAVMYLIDRAGAPYRVRKGANDNLARR